MAEIFGPTHLAPGSRTGGDPLLVAALAALVIALLIFAVGLGIGYYGDEFAHPAWNEWSVPPPLPY
jgi:TRAP-type C4-dicarboxylate transport system permease small subunit